MVETDTPSPPWQVSEWLNTPHPVTLAGLRGKVVVLHAFQMLCPGCVSDGLPQAARINAIFPSERVAVIGLHTVFEHHDVMGPKALRAFLSEYRFASPSGIDQAAHDSSIPLTMRAYGATGTPALWCSTAKVAFDSVDWAVEDLHLGAVIGELLVYARLGETPEITSSAGDPSRASCGDDGCVAGVTR
ncbi:MAG: TlpA family protein disulfide reductase [Gammaproteobacteria bacterium]|nr:TlpA family protein disulfide reductase [Gammaproteobacteria bacterium]